MFQDLFKYCCPIGVKQNKNDECHSTEEHLDDCKEEDLDYLFVELALSPRRVCLTSDSSNWLRVTSVQEIFEIFTMISGSYMLVGGNTAQGKT